MAAQPSNAQMDWNPLMRVTQAFTFEAAHHLPNVPDGHRCKRLHGHSYRVELTFEGPVDSNTGFVIDFFDIEAAFAPVLAHLDHHLLNEVPGLANPTAERIAQWVWEAFVHTKPFLVNVRLYETPMCWADASGQET